jgi:hypothetical protein
MVTTNTVTVKGGRDDCCFGCVREYIGTNITYAETAGYLQLLSIESMDSNEFEQIEDMRDEKKKVYYS